MKVKQQPRTTGGRTRQSDPIPSLAENRLRTASIRVTTARVQVLSALLGARSAVSHQDMQDILLDMDRVTLYRALDCLTAAGLAHKIAGDDRVFRYSAGNEHAEVHAAQPGRHPAQHQHSHFKCTRCTKVFCLDGAAETEALSAARSETAKHQSALRRQLQSVLQETLGKGFQSHDIELTIKGWCADCSH